MQFIKDLAFQKVHSWRIASYFLLHAPNKSISHSRGSVWERI